MGLTMNRLEDWAERLDAVLMDAERRPFVWGEHDCCIFAARCVEAISGVNPVPDAIGAYSDKKSAYLWLRDHFGDARSMISLFLGDEIDPNFVQRGSVALIESDGSFSIGVIDLSGEWIACVDEGGLRRTPKTTATAFWSV